MWTRRASDPDMPRDQMPRLSAFDLSAAPSVMHIPPLQVALVLNDYLRAPSHWAAIGTEEELVRPQHPGPLLRPTSDQPISPLEQDRIR